MRKKVLNQVIEKIKLSQAKIVYIVGPTGIGKTVLSLELADYFNTDIISADAFQVYCGMDIGTAKCDKKIREIYKHYLIDICKPGNLLF